MKAEWIDLQVNGCGVADFNSPCLIGKKVMPQDRQGQYSRPRRHVMFVRMFQHDSMDCKSF